MSELNKSFRAPHKVFLSFMLLAACTNGPCRQLRHPELATGTVAGQGDASASGQDATKISAPGTPAGQLADTSTSTDGRILVARPDGSLQCGMAKGKSPDEMEKELEGIKVYGKSKRPDGKMHIQVCGSPTGQMNVYEIPSGSQKEAERRGFKRFSPSM